VVCGNSREATGGSRARLHHHTLARGYGELATCFLPSTVRRTAGIVLAVPPTRRESVLSLPAWPPASRAALPRSSSPTPAHTGSARHESECGAGSSRCLLSSGIPDSLLLSS